MTCVQEGDNALNLAIKSHRLRSSGEQVAVVQYLMGRGSDPHLTDLVRAYVTCLCNVIVSTGIFTFIVLRIVT